MSPDRATEPDASAGTVAVVDASITADWVRSGHTTNVRTTVRNTGPGRATRTLTVTVGGDPVANRSVTLEPNEREVLAIEYRAVEGTVAVEGVEAGRIAVGDDDGSEGSWTEGRSTQSAGDGFDFQVVALLLAIAAVVGRAVRAGRN